MLIPWQSSTSHTSHTKAHVWSMNTLHTHTRVHIHWRTPICLYHSRVLTSFLSSPFRKIFHFNNKICYFYHIPSYEIIQIFADQFISSITVPHKPYHTIRFCSSSSSSQPRFFLSFFYQRYKLIGTLWYIIIFYIFFLFILLSFGASICRSDLDSSDIQIRDEINILSFVNSVYTKTDWDFFSFQWVISM